MKGLVLFPLLLPFCGYPVFLSPNLFLELRVGERDIVPDGQANDC